MTMTTTTIDDRHHRRGDLVSGGASTIIRGPLLLPAARTDPSDKTERFLVLPTAPSSRRESSLLAPHNEKTDWIQWRVHEAGCRATPRSGRHALPAAPANSRLEPLEGGQKPLRFRRVLAALLQCRRRVAEHPKPGAGGRVLRLLDGQKVDSFHCCLGVLCRGARCGRTVRGPQGAAQSARAARTWGPCRPLLCLLRGLRRHFIRCVLPALRDARLQQHATRPRVRGQRRQLQACRFRAALGSAIGRTACDTPRAPQRARENAHCARQAGSGPDPARRWSIPPARRRGG